MFEGETIAERFERMLEDAEGAEAEMAGNFKTHLADHPLRCTGTGLKKPTPVSRYKEWPDLRPKPVDASEIALQARNNSPPKEVEPPSEHRFLNPLGKPVQAK
ncbi:MAG: hypothetical protein ACJAQW_000661 [Paracoccaceae bacterium]